jgi:hypothetical protein
MAELFSDLALSKLALRITALEQEVEQHEEEKAQLLSEAAGHKQVSAAALPHRRPAAP